MDHILQKPVSPSNTAASLILVPLHISETNEWLLDQSSTRTTHLSRLMRAAYLFNKDMARSESGTYMLVITFDGTHRPELLKSFEGSGVGCCLIQLDSPSAQMYTDLLRGLAKKARLSDIKCNHTLDMFKPPEPLAFAFADCGDNLRLFSMLLYKIGCYGNYSEKLGTFKWWHFLSKESTSPASIKKTSPEIFAALKFSRSSSSSRSCGRPLMKSNNSFLPQRFTSS